jgi:hypothetical protein
MYSSSGHSAGPRRTNSCTAASAWKPISRNPGHTAGNGSRHPPNGERPEAEWGFEPTLGEDVERFARLHGYHRVRRIRFNDPEHLSPLVADLYRWWNRQRGVIGNRLLVDSFIVTEPYWSTRTGSVPYWLVFNKEPSEQSLEAYLDRSGPFDEIYVMLFSHGVNSIGLVPIERWRQFLRRARKRGVFIGVDEQEYPMDFAVFVRYYYDLIDKVKSRYPLPPPLSLGQLDDFLDRHQGHYQVQWLDEEGRSEYRARPHEVTAP